ncbi:hypothetical protein JXA59_01705 [Patescibacteria group bacterium]|nr:hypothetical protein [Patescibacteria group bacterium]
MSNKKQKLLAYGVLVGALAGAVLFGWLTLPIARGINGIPKQIRYQPPTGEQLITTSQDATIKNDTEFEYQGHRYRLDIQIDQPNISPLAGSFITGTIQLLKDGSRTSEVPDFMINSRAGISSGTPRDIPTVLVNLNALNQQMQFGSLPNSSRLKIDDQTYWLGSDSMFSWGRIIGIGFTRDGKPSRSGPYLYTAWDKVFISPQALDTAGVLDLSSGQAKFKYQTNGTRVASYLELAVSSYDNKMQSSRRVNFQDARKVTVPQPSSNSGTSDVYYEVVTSEPKLTANQTQRFSIGVVARKANGSINEDPTQRVRLMVMPSSTVFLPAATQANWSPSADSNLNITGTIQISTAGKFIETDETKYKYGSNLDHSGEIRTPTDKDPTAIYLDLIDGKATADFEYNGRPGPLPYLAITAQPADFFVPYKDWNTSPSALPDFKNHMWDDLIKRCEENNTCPTWYADERAYVNSPDYHREAAGITYPPLPGHTDEPNPRIQSNFSVYPYSASNSEAEYFLYQNKWHTRAEFTDLVIGATSIKLLSISSGAGSSIQWAWWWFMSLQIVQLLIWLIRVIIEKRKQNHGNA